MIRHPDLSATWCILKAHLLTKSAIQFTFKFPQWTAALLEFIISIISYIDKELKQH